MTDPRIVSALREATGADLKAWAKVALAEANEFPRDLGPSMLGLAALALAVARVMHTSDARIEQAGRADYLILDIPMPETHTMEYGACEIPAALAALLEGGR
jgi:hypothetical protein